MGRFATKWQVDQIIKRSGYLILGICIFTFISCARISRTHAGHIQTGEASWYGPNFHGKQTSNKEIYNMYDLTAAHRTLPFGTQVMVTNLLNDKSVNVRINDRGPFVEGRIIDLSYAAAKMIDMIGPGVIPVRIEIISDEYLPKSPVIFSVQVGSFIKKTNAAALKNKLSKKYEDVYLTVFKTAHQKYYRVRIKASSRQKAEELARQLNRAGYSVFIVEED